MDKHVVTHPKSWKLNSNENKETIATLSNVAEFHKQNVEQKSQTQEYIVYDSIYIHGEEYKMCICGDKSLDSYPWGEE